MPRAMKELPVITFQKAFGPGLQYRPYTPEDDARLAALIPPVMQEILQKDGWCSYKGQVLWLCDPRDWQLAANAWFPEKPDAQVLARTAFGDLFIWDGEAFWFILVHESLMMMLVDDPDWFFARMLPASDFAPQTYLPDRVGAAQKAAGKLGWDEMYSYIPAIALGGSVETSRIEKVKAREALILLAQLAPVRRK